MLLELFRFKKTQLYTQGVIKERKFDSVFFTLENGMAQKHIPEGVYEIGFNEVITPLTLKYRELYPAWFTFHLEVKNVPNAKNIYLHIGNTQKDTDGCILVADTSDITPPDENGFIGESRQCFQRFYTMIGNELRSKEKVYIYIKNL